MTREIRLGTRLARRQDLKPQENAMLRYAVIFFIIALVAALFGFGGIAASAAGIAQILFYIFIVVALISLVLSLIRR